VTPDATVAASMTAMQPSALKRPIRERMAMPPHLLPLQLRHVELWAGAVSDRYRVGRCRYLRMLRRQLARLIPKG
jgi:hypothetical protein